jgi:hypothetical protein
MDDKKERFIRDLEDLAKAHKNTAKSLEDAAEGLENGTINLENFLNFLEESDQRAYLEVSPRTP